MCDLGWQYFSLLTTARFHLEIKYLVFVKIVSTVIDLYQFFATINLPSNFGKTFIYIPYRRISKQPFGQGQLWFLSFNNLLSVEYIILWRVNFGASTQIEKWFERPFRTDCCTIMTRQLWKHIMWSGLCLLNL